MARLQNKKRACVKETVQNSRPHKKVKLNCDGQHDNQPSFFPPEFYDILPKVDLTRRALRELDRRNYSQPPTKPITSRESFSKGLARFARAGGPDLQDLRGARQICPEPQRNPMAPSRYSERSRPSGDSQSVDPTTVPTTVPGSILTTPLPPRVRKSSAYDANFEKHLELNNIHMSDRDVQDDPLPKNLDHLQQELSRRRASVSLSSFDDAAFKHFRKLTKTVAEGAVLRKIVPIISGATDIPNDGPLPFNNLESMTKIATVNPTPDFFDGARPEDIEPRVAESLNRWIIPTKRAGVPVAPNFFLEAKAPQAGSEVLERQACHDGAYGARAMYRLQNYGQKEAIYDGNAYTISAAYHSGFSLLQLYAHHVTGLSTNNKQPEYHMTLLETYVLNVSRESFIDGITAFRNARDMAMQYRDGFISAANQVDIAASQDNHDDPDETRGSRYI
ncbi:hypothetical protein O1611_g6951 [Lasiodiplodia mahajangana]|uniref:Uncharacterized protein n=1 Tax=Lasiodiplodia mahajangana TaxID=1108764 RepID=A0ACC2JHH8_9PEZI|nr:hypothetical protein O1611_g6951 [Lasiodiplodia mahajangana]